MDINTFKLGDLGSLTKINLTKAEAAAVCCKGGNKVRKQLLTLFIQSLMDIKEINNIVGKNNVVSRRADVKIIAPSGINLPSIFDENKNDK